MKLYQYAVLWHPTEKQTEDDGAKDLVIVPITTVLAGTDQEVVMTAARQIPTDYEGTLDQVEVVVRPF